MVGSSAHLPYFKGLILGYSKNKAFHVILLFWGIFSNILMLAGIEFCFGEVRGLSWSTFPWNSTSIYTLMER